VLGRFWGQLSLNQALRFVVAVAGGAALLLVWDAARAQPTGIMSLAWANNDPARLIRSGEVIPRLAAWWQHVSRVFMPATAPALLLGVTAVVGRIVREPPSRAMLADMILLWYLTAYALLHWLIAFNTYDRYILPILPLLLVLAARGSVAAWDWWRMRLPSAELALAGLVVMVLVFSSAQNAANDRAAEGADGSSYSGIDQLAAYLNQLPLGAIIYDHWLGWELDYYLGQWTNKRRVYYPTPNALSAGASRQPDRALRYFVAPEWEAAAPWIEALHASGFAPRRVFQVEQFDVYELTPPG
jgi:hypothetical protein